MYKRIIFILPILIVLVSGLSFALWYLNENNSLWIYTDNFTLSSDNQANDELTIYAGVETGVLPVRIDTLELTNLLTDERQVININQIRVLSDCESFKGQSGCDFKVIYNLNTRGLQHGLYRLTINASLNSHPTYFAISNFKTSNAPILVAIPTYTWHAYTKIGGGSFYVGDGEPFYEVSLNRPYFSSSYNSMPASLSYLQILSSQGFEFDIIDSEALEALPMEVLEKYSLLLFTGHDEYFTMPILEKTSKFVSNGKSAAVFSGNFSYYLVEKDGQVLRVKKRLPLITSGPGKDSGLVDKVLPGQSQVTYWGLGFKYAAYPVKRKTKSFKEAQSLNNDLTLEAYEGSEGMWVLNPKHPIFNKTNLKAGDLFCDDANLVAVEMDGLPLTNEGKVDYTSAPEAPQRIIPLAYGWAIRGWSQKPSKRILFADISIGKGKVVHGGSVGWYLAIQKSPVCRQIFLNAVDYLLSYSSSNDN